MQCVHSIHLNHSRSSLWDLGSRETYMIVKLMLLAVPQECPLSLTQEPVSSASTHETVAGMTSLPSL